MTYSEILDLIQRYTGTQNTTNSSYPIAAKTVDINNALNKFLLLAIQSEGKWGVDDSNQVDYPIITTNIVSGQQDYSFVTDQVGNQVLDIYKVRIKDANGNWSTLRQIDLQTGDKVSLLGGGDDYLNSTTQGIPTEYRLSANGIFLTVIPNFNSTGGLEVYVNRTPTYFTVSDTTKKAGIPWGLHEYLAIRPAYYYCLQKGLPQTAGLAAELMKFEGDDSKGITGLIDAYYSKRNKDEKTQIRTTYRNPR